MRNEEEAPMIRRLTWILFSPLLYSGCTMDPADSLDSSEEQAEPLEERERERERVRVELSAAPGNARILYALRNDTSQPVHVLSWVLPNGGSRPLSVTREGVEVPFVGSWGDHGRAPSDNDYIVVAPGERIVREVDLLADFDLADGGTVEVANQVLAESLLVEHEDVEVDLSSKVALDVAPSARKDSDELGVSTSELRAGDTSCSEAQLATLFQGFIVANHMMNEVQRKIAADTWRGANFKKWFGVANVPIVDDKEPRTRLRKILRMLSGDIDVIYTCRYHASCDGGFVARAQSVNNTPLLRFCPAFFNAVPSTFGPEGRGTTIVHELAHFAGASLDIYSEASAAALARNNPSAARDNASNYQYYAYYSVAQWP
jgi:Lysine-specific metallo-endopeptidase